MALLGKNWWVFLFCLGIALFAYPQLAQKKKEVVEFQSRLEQMAAHKERALEVGLNLKERIACQSDPAWIELVLMRDLGVVPEGFLKVHFKGSSR